MYVFHTFVCGGRAYTFENSIACIFIVSLFIVSLKFAKPVNGSNNRIIMEGL